MSGGNLWRLYVFIHRFYQNQCLNLSVPEQPLWNIGKHRFALPEEHRNEVMLATAKFEFEKAQLALENKWQQRDFAVGGTFTMADVLLAHTLNWADRFKMSVKPSFFEYRDQMYQRSACQESLRQIGA